MVKIPEYTSDVALRPQYQQENTSRANADDFGAAIGRGMVGLAQGIGQAGDAFLRIQQLDDETRAKDADNAYAEWMRNRMYGDGGYMTMEGRNAVDGRASFEREAEEKRKEFGQSLKGGASKLYDGASKSRIQGVYQQSIVHSANERKSWFKDASTSRTETFANDALVNYKNGAQVEKNIIGGIMELREQGKMLGWDADTLKLREAEYASGVHKNVALRIAQDDPLAADAYVRKHKEALTGAHQYDLNATLESAVAEEQSKREAEAIVTRSRSVEGGDITPAGRAQAGRTIGESGPTRVRQFLIDKAPRGAYSVDMLDEAFATNLAALIQDAPPEIRKGLGLLSGHRSFEHQQRLFNNSNKSGKMVARPGHSNHEVRSDGTAKAVDLSYNGQSLKHAPKAVLDYVHGNAGKYGMYFPMSYEPWHIEPVGTRGGRGGTVAPRNNTVAPRSTMPSYDEIEDHLAGIADPKVRDLTRKRINSMIEARGKADEANEKAAKAELWRVIDMGGTPDDVPIDVRQAAGMAAVTSAWGYQETVAKGREVENDEGLLYQMRLYSATNPVEFSGVDLNEYRDRLSKEAIKELTGVQTTALTDQRKAKEDGINLTTAFSQATSSLEAVGITTTGREGSAREEAAKRVATFQNALAMEMETFKEQQKKNPTQIDIQSMINKLMLPIVIKQPGSFGGIFGDSETDGFLFEAGNRPDASTVDLAVEYTDIPVDLRRGIALDLERELGRKPSEEEVIQRYEQIAVSE